MAKPKSFKDLQAQWYERLEQSGFKDIENCKYDYRPLKQWHSLKITSYRFQTMRDTGSMYQRKVDNFINHPSFKEVCKIMVDHGNCKCSAKQIEEIWEMHSLGHTVRRIAVDTKRTKTRVHDIIKRLREWMNLL